MVKVQVEKLIKKSIYNIEEIRNKDGIIVSRVLINGQSYILKFFEKEEYSREIDIYKLFKELNIKTLNVYELGKNYILMEDVNNSKEYKLATAEQLKDDNTIKNLAIWYRDLHEKGKLIDLTNFYCENDVITKDNIKGLSGLLQQRYIDLILNSYDYIEKAKTLLCYNTITYNDFSFENLIVGPNCAFMYDYNFVGKGYVYADIRNVLVSLDDRRKEVFLNAYGKTIKDFHLEKEIDKILATLVALITASKKDKVPKWIESTLEYVSSDNFENELKNLKRILNTTNF